MTATQRRWPWVLLPFDHLAHRKAAITLCIALAQVLFLSHFLFLFPARLGVAVNATSFMQFVAHQEDHADLLDPVKSRIPDATTSITQSGNRPIVRPTSELLLHGLG